MIYPRREVLNLISHGVHLNTFNIMRAAGTSALL